MKRLRNCFSLFLLTFWLGGCNEPEISSPTVSARQASDMKTGNADHSAPSGGDPLPSWSGGKSKQAIIAFVDKVTDPDSSAFVPAPERIATFDNDGTLWSEKPLYFQFAYALDRVKQTAKDHPEWQNKEPFASVLKGDLETALAGGEHAVLEIVAATHSGMTDEDFSAAVGEWLASAHHPQKQRPYTEMVFKPMLELLDYLRANEFKTFIVSGGGVDFMRVFAEATYGIPPEQVVGSSMKATYEVREGKPLIVKAAELNFIDDKEGKPVGIHQYIGRRPIFAAGNSDGDYQMLEWTTAGDGPRFALIVHHTDAEREWAYDRESSVGALAKGLDDAERKGWVLVDMKTEWKTVYPE